LEDDGEIESSDIAYKKAAAELNSVFAAILSFFVVHSGVKAKFSSPQYQFVMSGQGVSVKSEKMNTEICFGIYRNEFFMDSYIEYPWYLKNMDDEFWANSLELDSLGKFKFQENATPSSSEAKNILKTMGKSKSNIFNMIRNYILLENSGGSIDLGSLEIMWPINTPWEKLLHNGVGVFKRLYRINYLLYRRYYIYIKKTK